MRRRLLARAPFVLLALLLVVSTIGSAGVFAGPRDNDKNNQEEQTEVTEDDGGRKRDREQEPAVEDVPAAEAVPPVQVGAAPVPIVDNATVTADTDGDLVPDVNDNCVDTPNADQTDANGDGVGDACQAEPDSDGDGVRDPRDNCVNVSNPNQRDNDADGLGDACDEQPKGDQPTEPTGNDAPTEDTDSRPNRDDPPANADEPAASGDDEPPSNRDDRREERRAAREERQESRADESTSDEGERATTTSRETPPVTARAPLPREGRAPAFPAPPRAPEGPAPVLNPFELPPETYATIIRIDTGDMPRRTSTASWQATAMDDEEATDLADQAPEPASFLEQEEALINGAVTPDTEASEDTDPITTDDERADDEDGDTREPDDDGDNEDRDTGERDDEAFDRTPDDESATERDTPAANRELDPEEWTYDDYFDGGVARSHPDDAKIAGTDDDAIYLSQRRGDTRRDSGEFAYAIPVPEDDVYQVRLHFAEIYWDDDDRVGDRVFSVDAEGEPILEDYDITDDVGAMTAVVKQFEVEVDDGVLDLFFYASEDEPMVAAIEVLGEPTGERWVDVDKTARQVRLMVGGSPIATYTAQMSVGPEDDFHDTMPGSYNISSKIAELTWTPYARNYFMYWAGFDAPRENGFHSWVMDYKGRVVPNGDGPTWGCVATAPDEAAEIYAFVDIGTRVEVHW